MEYEEPIKDYSKCGRCKLWNKTTKYCGGFDEYITNPLLKADTECSEFKIK